MKRLTIAICSLFLFGACNNETKTESVASDSTSASDTATTAPVTPPDSATIAKAWQEYMTPGKMHKMMATWDGTWNGDVTMWMTPSDPPMKSTATSTSKMIFNGLYLESVNKGNFGGMPFEGKSILAYDKAKKKFISTWIDNMGCGIMIMEGDYDSTTKTLNFTGKMTNPVDGKELAMRETVQIIDDKTQLMKMYGPDYTGKEFQTMEIRMTRK